MKRPLNILIAAVAVILLFTACQQFLEDPEDFLSYWASEAFVKDHSIGSAHRPDGAGVPCVASSASVYITLSVHNPKGFSFVMPTSSAPAGIVEFKELPSQPTAETDYALERTGSGALKLTYKPSLLQKYEQGSGSLNPTITLKAKDGRVFKQTYTFGIKSNTPPPKPEIIIAKTKRTVTEPKSYYVLCLKFNSNEMTRKIGSGTIPVHKDVRKITIKKGSSNNGSSYELSYNGDGTDFQTPDGNSFIESGEVEKLDISSPDVPPGKWVLYFNTGVKVESSNEQTSYTITLSDEGGVVSDSVTAELKEKFEVKFDAKDGNYTPETQYILKGDKVTKPSQDPERMGHIFGGWYTDTSYSTQWDFVTNTVTSNMTLYAKWTEAKYTVKFRVADGEGKLKGDYNDGSYHSQETQNGGDEVKFENVPAGTQVNFTATPTYPTQYKVGNWTCTSSTDFTGTSGSSIASLTVRENTTVTVQFVPLSALNLTELKIHGLNALGGSVTLPYTVAQVAKSDISLAFSGHTGIPFTIEPSDGVTLTPGATKSLTIKVAVSPGNYLAWSKTVSITRSKNSVANLTSFKLNGETKTVPFAGEYTVASGTATVTDFAFDADSTGATASVSPQGNVNIPVGSGRNFTITVKAQDGTVTQNVIFTVKRKEYTVNYSVEGGQGKIQAGLYTLTTNSSLSVAYNGNVTFTAHPDPGWEVDSWKVDGSTVSSQTGTTYTLSNVTGPKTVTVKFKPGVFDLAGGPGAWKRLKEEVEKTEGAHTITISGEITATNDPDNNGKISIRRELIIKSSGSSASLNASNLSGVFDVNNKLTLENITLKNGTEPGNRTGAGAYVNSTLIMKGSSAITNCSAHKGGGVYVNNGTLIMQDSSTISSCTATDKGSGVYVAGTFEMKGNARVNTNNDVYLESGKSITVTGSLSHHPAARITPNNYTNGRVLATGAAEKANFKVTPQDGNKYWRFKKQGGEVKFVPAKLKVTFNKIKCVEVEDASSEAEYYWTMKVGKYVIAERPSNSVWDAKKGHIYEFIENGEYNKYFNWDFSYFPISEIPDINTTPKNYIPVYINIMEYDKSDPDDHIGTTKAHLTYDYDNDQWKWEYDGSQSHGNQESNPHITIGDGGEEIFTEEYRTNDGDTDVTITISWKE
ncbi:InlB B-repeat-containing protein [Treponema denticola]|uniref:InlB B-repeat-containing protein n=1 Tax=Treponema denticola TaxID=158 RepID=UPI0020A54A4B|nr:InlB B-repeat-containing protein [Treponema denticola]UTC97459.1 InlB B-repeat-containing protein [Treponema denticola]